MLENLAFTLIAALLVYLAGRKDASRDPRLTIGLLLLLTAFPLLGSIMPKLNVLPSAQAAGTPSDSHAISWILAAWSIGFLWQAARLMMATLTIERWKRQSTEIRNLDGVSIRQCDLIQSPVAVGIKTRMVLVPCAWNEWSNSWQQAVIAHELAHHQRRDPLWRLLAAMACAIHWYHPLVHWMSKRFAMQAEFACDAAVLQSGMTPKTYARVLCDVATRLSPSPIALAMAEQHSLEKRVQRLITPSVSHRSAQSLAVLSILGLLTACALAMLDRKQNAAQAAPQSEVELRLSANPFPGEP